MRAAAVTRRTPESSLAEHRDEQRDGGDPALRRLQPLGLKWVLAAGRSSLMFATKMKFKGQFEMDLRRNTPRIMSTDVKQQRAQQLPEEGGNLSRIPLPR